LIDEYNNAANIRKKIVNTTKIKKKNYFEVMFTSNISCHIPISLAHIVIHLVAIVVDAFIGIALWEFFPKLIANGDDERCLCFLFIEGMIHCC